MKNVYFRAQLIPNEQNIPTVARFVTDMTRPLGFSERRCKLICFTVESVLELRAPQIGTQNPFVEIEVSKSMDSILISVSDKGLPYVLNENQRRMIEHGLADSYRLEQLGADGQRLTFIIKQEIGTEIQMPRVEDETLLDAELSCGAVADTDEDINEAIKCLYSAYGYEYIHQALYQIDHFRETVNAGDFLPVMARNAHGQVLGLGSLMRDADFPGLYEISSLATKPFARGHHVANQIVSELLRGMDALPGKTCYCCPVAFHTATQKICNSASLTPTGFVLHGFPPNAVGSFRDGDRRPDYALCFRVTDKTRPHTLYLDEEPREMVAGIFREEQLNFRVSDEEAFDPENRVAMAVDRYTASTIVVADACGREFDEKLAGILSDRDVKATDMILLFLNVNQPGSIHAYRSLRQSGFIFTGTFPGCDNGDYIVMQHMMGIPFERNKICLTPNYSDYLDRILAVNGLAPNGEGIVEFN